MSTEDTFEYDRSVDRAWDEFRALLADHVADMQEGDLLTIDSTFEVDAAADLPPRGVQFLAWDGDTVRCEVPSNHYLTGLRALTHSDELRLIELGWHRPTGTPGDDLSPESPAFWVDLPTSWADRLAAMSVAVFREVWGVPHPTFLAYVDPSFEADEAEWPTICPPMESPTIDMRVPIAPRDVAHLQDLIEQTLEDNFEAYYSRDDEGDVVMLLQFTDAHFWSDAERPGIRIFVPLVRDITNRTRAAEVAADLNGRWPYFRAVVTGDRLDAICDLPADPFVPQHLNDVTAWLIRIILGADKDFAQSLGGVFPKKDMFAGDGHDAPPEGTNEANIDETPEETCTPPTPFPLHDRRSIAAHDPRLDQLDLFENTLPDNTVQPTLFDNDQ
ncbi:MAG: hypothetical protein GX542_10040 [Rhodococcus sp.]|nr:hypothetical protein [Rhodococcus sp. (in: high G+C Gram-positive bacteria)]